MHAKESPREAGLKNCPGRQSHYTKNILEAPVEDSPLPPSRLLNHIAEVLDTTVGYLLIGVPASAAGREVLAHCADRLRAVSQVIDTAVREGRG